MPEPAITIGKKQLFSAAIVGLIAALAAIVVLKALGMGASPGVGGAVGGCVGAIVALRLRRKEPEAE